VSDLVHLKMRTYFKVNAMTTVSRLTNGGGAQRSWVAQQTAPVTSGLPEALVVLSSQILSQCVNYLVMHP
jgi:hypothetical protein